MTDWDQCYREGNMPWNRGEPSPPLAQYLSRNPLEGRVLVPGCGLGHDVALLARQGARPVGFDISPLALEKARAAHPGLPPETFVLGDLYALPHEFIGAFDAVVEHTCLSAMPPEWRPKYRDAVASVLKPGGLIVGVWYINPDLAPGETGPPYPLPVAELDALFAEGFDVVENYVPDVGYQGRVGRELLRVLRKRLMEGHRTEQIGASAVRTEAFLQP